MISCEKYCSDLSAYLDNELDADASGALRIHLEVCPACREVLEDLEATRGALGRTFTETMASAPPPPPAMRPAARKTGRLRWIAALGAVAAVLVIAVFHIYEPKEAAAADLLKQAAGRHLKLEDVEFFATVESELFQTLGRLFDVKPKKHTKPTYLRILAAAPDRLVIHDVENLNTREIKSGEVVGYRGQAAWKYDAKKGHVVVGKPDEITFGFLGGSTRIKKGPGQADLFKSLSWDFVRSMAENEDDQRITEITGPFDRRIGRRVFRIEPKPGDTGKTQWVWGRAVLTINPGENLIEKMVFDLDFSGVSLLRITLELAEANPGLADAVFDYRTYAPPDTPVVEKDPDEKKAAGKRQI